MPKYQFTLYIAGDTSGNREIQAYLTNLFGKYFKNDYSLNIIDILKNTGVSESEKIIAVPTLVRNQPPPLKKLVGDLTENDDLIKMLSV